MRVLKDGNHFARGVEEKILWPNYLRWLLSTNDYNQSSINKKPINNQNNQTQTIPNKLLSIMLGKTWKTHRIYGTQGGQFAGTRNPSRASFGRWSRRGCFQKLIENNVELAWNEIVIAIKSLKPCLKLETMEKKAKNTSVKNPTDGETRQARMRAADLESNLVGFVKKNDMTHADKDTACFWSRGGCRRMQCGWARWNKHPASRPELLQALDQASGGRFAQDRVSFFESFVFGVF